MSWTLHITVEMHHGLPRENDRDGRFLLEAGCHINGVPGLIKLYLFQTLGHTDGFHDHSLLGGGGRRTDA